jgi:hypothetical protein
MSIRIITDESLPDLSARMRKSRFAAIPAIVKSKIQIGSDITVAPVVFDKAYSLNLVSDQGCEDNTLYVSPGVKKLFYADQDELAV